MVTFPRRLAQIDVSAELLRDLLRLPPGVVILDAFIPYPPVPPPGEPPAIFRLTLTHDALPELPHGQAIPLGRAIYATGKYAAVSIDAAAFGGEDLDQAARARAVGLDLAAALAGCYTAVDEEGGA